MSTQNTDTTWSNLQSNKTNLLSYGNIQYQYFHKDWMQLLDVVEGGEREVKERGVEYLPKTSGMKANTCNGDDVYNSYKTRAVFYAYAKDTLPAMLGVMHSKKPKIEIPESISFMNKEATNPASWRVGLDQVLREINKNQLEYGRYGILADIPATETPAQDVMPKLIGYEGFFILDWSTREMPDGDIVVDYVLLAEEKPVEDERTARFEEPQMQLRVLALNAENEYFYMLIDIDGDDKEGAKALGELTGLNLDNPVEAGESTNGAIYPNSNEKRLEFIPFVFINVTNLFPDVEKSPLLQLSNMDVSIYRGDADWAQAYFMQGQDTLVATGVSEGDNVEVGAGTMIRLSAAEAKVYFAGVNGDGLSEMRERQRGLQADAVALGISLVDQNQAESGKALETRSAIKNAPLSTVAQTGAKGLAQALRYATFWKTGEFDVNGVLVEPNVDFTTSTKAAKELMDLWTTKLNGAPISMRDVHKFARDNNFTDKDFDETQQDIDEEV